MKIRLSELKRIIKEVADDHAERSVTEGSFKVTFTNKDGTPGSSTFPNEKLANMYARNVKNANVAPVDVDIPDVAITIVAPASADDMRASSKAFYAQAQRGEKFNPRAEEEDTAARAEHAAERDAEFWADSKFSGQSTEDAFADRDFLNGRMREAVEEVVDDETGEVFYIGAGDDKKQTQPVPVWGADDEDDVTAVEDDYAADQVENAEAQWQDALTQYADNWTDFSVENVDASPEDAASDAAEGFFSANPQWERWSTLLNMPMDTMRACVQDCVYDAMTSAKPMAPARDLTDWSTR